MQPYRSLATLLTIHLGPNEVLHRVRTCALLTQAYQPLWSSRVSGAPGNVAAMCTEDGGSQVAAMYHVDGCRTFHCTPPADSPIRSKRCE